MQSIARVHLIAETELFLSFDDSFCSATAAMASSDEEAGTLPLEERPTPRRSQRNRYRVANREIAQSSSDDEVVPSTLPGPGMHSFDGDNEEVPPSLHHHRYRTSDSGWDENQNKDDNSDVDEEFVPAERFSSDDDSDIPLASINAKKQSQKQSPLINSSKKNTNKSVSISVAQLFFFLQFICRLLRVCLTHSLHCRYKEALDTVPKSS